MSNNMSIKDIIKSQEEEFEKLFPREGGDGIYRFYRLDFPEGDSRSIKAWHSQSVKQILQAVVEREKEEKVKDVTEEGLNIGDTSAYNHAKSDTIAHLEEVLKEL